MYIFNISLWYIEDHGKSTAYQGWQRAKEEDGDPDRQGAVQQPGWAHKGRVERGTYKIQRGSNRRENWKKKTEKIRGTGYQIIFL